MRAYMHFILVNLLWTTLYSCGALETKAVPLKLNTDLEEIPSRNTVKEIYTSILSDIETARKLINKKRMGSSIFIPFLNIVSRCYGITGIFIHG